MLIMDPAQCDSLMVQISEGDMNAFELLFNEFSSKVMGYARSIVKNPNLAEEITQDVWMKLVKAAPRFKSQGYFKAWLMTLTRNTCLTYLKKEGKYFPKEDIAQNLEEEEDFEQKLYDQFEIKRLKEALFQLPDSQRVALTLLISEGLTYDKLADSLSLSLSATKSLIYRARQSLLKLMGENIL